MNSVSSTGERIESLDAAAARKCVSPATILRAVATGRLRHDRAEGVTWVVVDEVDVLLTDAASAARSG